MNSSGNLIIEFVVVFPNSISDERKEYLQKIIPHSKKQNINNYDDYEIKLLSDYEEPNQHSQQSHTDPFPEIDDNVIGCQQQ